MEFMSKEDQSGGGVGGAAGGGAASSKGEATIKYETKLMKQHFEMSVRKIQDLFCSENAVLYCMEYDTEKNKHRRTNSQIMQGIHKGSQLQSKKKGSKELLLGAGNEVRVDVKEDDTKDRKLLRRASSLLQKRGSKLNIDKKSLEFANRDRFYEKLWNAYMQQNEFLKAVTIVFLVTHIALFWICAFSLRLSFPFSFSFLSYSLPSRPPQRPKNFGERQFNSILYNK